MFEDHLVRGILCGCGELGWVSGSCGNGMVCGGWHSLRQKGQVQASWDGYLYVWLRPFSTWPNSGEKKICRTHFFLQFQVTFLNSIQEKFYNLGYIL